MLRIAIPILAIALSGASALAQDSLPGEQTPQQMQSKIEALERRIAELEARLATLEKLVEPVEAQLTAELRQQRWQQKARERMGADAERRTPEELREAERLYQVANENWRSAEARVALEQMIQKYPDVNRTGCALVYLGQMSRGQEKVDYLRRAIEHHADCFYGDGVQAGPYAMFLLAHHYVASDEPELAQPLIEALREEHPEAIDHRGRLLIDQLPE